MARARGEALHHYNEVFRLHEQAISSSSEGISITDMRTPAHPLVYVNAGFERMTGYSYKEAIMRNGRFLQGPGTDWNTVRAVRAALDTGQAFTGELLLYRKDGTPFWCRLSLTPIIDERGELTHYVGVQSDISARVETENKLRETLRQLEQVNAALREANAAMKQDLRMAADVQQALLPKRIPYSPRFRIAWKLQACEELAGDILNVFRLDETHLGFYLLDVTGHGTPAALLAFSISQMLSPTVDSISLVWEQNADTSSRQISSPASVANRLNRHFPWTAETGQFFTLIYGILAEDTLQFRYVAAGHPPPLVFADDTEVRAQESPGLPVGLSKQSYQEESLQLHPGDRLVAYSDGITEVRDRKGNLFGKNNLIRVMQMEKKNLPASALNVLYQKLTAWKGKKGFQDDVSTILIDVLEER